MLKRVATFRLQFLAGLVAAGICVNVAEIRTVAAGSRVVYLVGQLADENLITFLASNAANDPEATVLLDTPTTAPYLKEHLKALRPERVVPVGTFPERGSDLERRLGLAMSPPFNVLKNIQGPVAKVILCPAKPRSLLLQAASLAGAEK